MAEGSMWEAFEHAAFAGLDNLTAVIDVNRLGQTRETMHGWDLNLYSRRLTAFGWPVIEVDGHDVDAIGAAYREAVGVTGRPTAIVARTIKGRGVRRVAERNGMQGNALDAKHEERALAELGAATHRRLTVAVQKPRADVEPHRFQPERAQFTRYERRST